MSATPVYPRRERSTRIRTATTRLEQPDDEMQISSAAAVAAAVVQSEGYKPREERGWEEFHPNLEIDTSFIVFQADDVDGTAKSLPGTPLAFTGAHADNKRGSPIKDANVASANGADAASSQTNGASTSAADALPGTPTRRRSNRPRDSYFPFRQEMGTTPKTPKVLPIYNQTPKERLDLRQPQYRKTDRILLFESKKFGQAKYVDKAMMNVGYQESDNFIRDDQKLIKASDANIEDEADSPATKTDNEASSHSHALGRVEYDMDEQDDMWLEAYNEYRTSQGWSTVTREHFEITMTKIEKEWHALEKRIPKPNPKPPQTHRPRSSSAAAVNGEPQAGEEQDSKCAICDDGDCENTNAIVFCDGCDLAVHQECYGVPFIPEGQWLCRKCQLIGRGIPTCIFCPNSDGAFKQTNSSKWAHLLCAMWIPEVSLGNHTFMEPVMDVEKVPKSRWKLTCYICQQQMGACIQCGNKSCYQAFHVTCARRAKLFLRMKNSSGALDVLDGSTNLKALCDKHCPSEYAKENGVSRATRRAKKFYKKTMRDRIWANTQAAALSLAATHRNALMEHPADESQMTGAKVSAVLGDVKKNQPGKSVWKLPSGAPIIPQAVFDIVDQSLAKFSILKRREFVSDASRYWTLKREMRRGAALLKRLQLQMETFSSMELTRRNFAAMGPSGKTRLSRRIEFAETLIKDLEQLQVLSEEAVKREEKKLEEALLMQGFVDTVYFPIHKTFPEVMVKVFKFDDGKNVFKEGLLKIQDKVDDRFYTTTEPFAQALCQVVHDGINKEWESEPEVQPKLESVVAPLTKVDYSDIRERKKLGKRILKGVQPLLESALKLESRITNKPYEDLKQELGDLIEASFGVQPLPSAAEDSQQSKDVIMVDAAEITVAPQEEEEDDAEHEIDEQVDIVMTEPLEEGSEDLDKNQEGRSIEVSTLGTGESGIVAEPVPEPSAGAGIDKDESMAEGVKSGNAPDTPPATNGYVAAAPSTLPGPPTPPQSNGSLSQEQVNILTDGGVPWYLKEFEPIGTSAVAQPVTGGEVLRSHSEALTEMDEDELKGLGVDFPSTSNRAVSPVSTSTVEQAIIGSAKKSTKSKKRKPTTYRGRR